MPNRRQSPMDVRGTQVLLRRGVCERQVAQQLGVYRGTVKRYRVWAAEQGLELQSLLALHVDKGGVLTLSPSSPYVWRHEHGNFDRHGFRGDRGGVGLGIRRLP